MLELQELTEIKDGKITGPMVPVQDAECFFSQTVGAEVYKLWRICADMSYPDGGETGTADFLLALISGKALVAFLDFGTHCRGVALKNNGRPVDVFSAWRKETDFRNAPKDEDISGVMESINVQSEIATIRLMLDISDFSTDSK